MNSTQNSHLSNPNSGNLSTGQFNKSPKKEHVKDREKKMKDLKSQLSRMEKTLVEAKKLYEEKKKKNDAYVLENGVN